jgi:chromate reductase
MKILAFAATSSSQSINKKLVTHATEKMAALHAGTTTEIIDINDYELPLFSLDREAQLGKPDLAKAFFDKIGGADLVIISFAEHNGSYTAAYKNLFDWASRIDQKVFQGKAMIMLSTSPGPGGGKTVLGSAVTSAPYFGAELKGSLSLPKFFDNFNMESGTISDETIANDLQELLSKAA